MRHRGVRAHVHRCEKEIRRLNAELVDWRARSQVLEEALRGIVDAVLKADAAMAAGDMVDLGPMIDLAHLSLAALGLPDEEGEQNDLVERAAEAIWNADLESAKGRQPWESRPPVVKEHYRNLARAALREGCHGGPYLTPQQAQALLDSNREPFSCDMVKLRSAETELRRWLAEVEEGRDDGA